MALPTVDVVLEQVEPSRAFGEVEVSVQLNAVDGVLNIEAPIQLPMDALGSPDFERVKVCVVPRDALGLLWYVSTLDQSATGNFQCVLANATPGQKGEVGLFRVDITLARG